MKKICKHAYPSDLCGTCNPPVKEKADDRLALTAGSPSSDVKPMGAVTISRNGYVENLETALADAAELLAEIMRDEVNHQDEAEKWLRAYAPQHLFTENA